MSIKKFSEHEYSELKEFLSFYSAHYMPIDQLPPELRPVACLEMMEKRSPKMVLQGLRQAINDIIEMARRADHKEIEKIDSELKSQNVVTLSELRRRFSADYARIIKRAKINNEVEYYLVINIINDNPESLNKEERDIISKIILEFEEKIAKSTK